MYHLIAEDSFDGAHFLPNYDGKCKNLHGHTWRVQVDIITDRLDDNDFVIDFTKIKEIIRELDHRCLNDILPNPTAENIAKYLHDRISVYPRQASIKVTVWETPHNQIAYFEDARVVSC